jgi:hypothetical protein
LSFAINKTRPRERSEGRVVGPFSARALIIRHGEANKSNKFVWGGKSEVSRLRGKHKDTLRPWGNVKL